MECPEQAQLGVATEVDHLVSCRQPGQHAGIEDRRLADTGRA